MSVYRPAWFLRLGGWLCRAGFFMVGLSGIGGFFAGAKSVGVSGLVVSLFVVAASFGLGWLFHIDCLVASEDGLVYFAVYRRRRVPWGAVDGFGTGHSDGMAGWPAVTVRLEEEGGREVKQLIGTRRRAERVAAELEEALRGYRPPPVSVQAVAEV